MYLVKKSVGKIHTNSSNEEGILCVKQRLTDCFGPSMYKSDWSMVGRFDRCCCTLPASPIRDREMRNGATAPPAELSESTISPDSTVSFRLSLELDCSRCLGIVNFIASSLIFCAWPITAAWKVTFVPSTFTSFSPSLTVGAPKARSISSSVFDIYNKCHSRIK